MPRQFRFGPAARGRARRAVMAIPGYVEYQRREFCKDIRCPIQKLLDQAAEASAECEEIRGVCKSDCIHTTYEFHHWLIQHGYEVVRSPKTGSRE
jgi:hypothetical protein